MKKWVLLLFTLPTWALASHKPPLSAEARLVRDAYAILKRSPASAQAQQNYLRVFPKSNDKFLRIFMDAPTYGQLYYDSHDYIEVLRQLGKIYPARVLNICFAIEKKMTRASDAVGLIEDVTVRLGISHPRSFALEASRLSAAEQVALCRFLADEEGIIFDKNYGQLAKRLQQVGAAGLATKLQQAKAWRLKQPRA